MYTVWFLLYELNNKGNINRYLGINIFFRNNHKNLWGQELEWWNKDWFHFLFHPFLLYSNLHFYVHYITIFVNGSFWVFFSVLILKTRLKQTFLQITNIWRWLTNIWRDGQHHYFNTNQNYNQVSPSTQTGWPESKNLQTSAGEGVKKREPSYTAGGNVNWYRHYGKQYGNSLKN